MIAPAALAGAPCYDLPRPSSRILCIAGFVELSMMKAFSGLLPTLRSGLRLCKWISSGFWYLKDVRFIPEKGVLGPRTWHRSFVSVLVHVWMSIFTLMKVLLDVCPLLRRSTWPLHVPLTSAIAHSMIWADPFLLGTNYKLSLINACMGLWSPFGLGPFHPVQKLFGIGVTTEKGNTFNSVSRTVAFILVTVRKGRWPSLELGFWTS